MNRSQCNHGNCVRPRRLFVFRYDSCSYVVPDLEKKEKKKTRLTQKCFIFSSSAHLVDADTKPAYANEVV